MKHGYSLNRVGRGRRAFAFLLSLVMICGTISGSGIVSMAGEETEFAVQDAGSETAVSNASGEETASTGPATNSDQMDSADSGLSGETSQEELNNSNDNITQTESETKEEAAASSEPVADPATESNTAPMADGEANADSSNKNIDVSDGEESSDSYDVKDEDPAAYEEEEEVEESASLKLAAISGTTTIGVGESTTLTSNGSGYNYQRWIVLNRSGDADTSNTYVSVNNNSSNTTTVTGRAAGTTTVYHQGWNGTGWTTIDSIQVTVKDIRQVTFTFNVTDAKVVLYHYTANDLSDLEMLGEVSANGSITSSYDVNTNNYWVFLAKPSDNYLLTGLGATGAGDIYPISNSNYGNIEVYPKIHELTKQYGNGYYAVFGYRRESGYTLDNQTLTLVGQSPGISVSATPDTAVDLSPGQVVNLTLEVTPGQLTGRNVNVNSVTLSNLNIGGNPITIDGSDTVTLTKNSEGRYILTVPYTITEADCANPTVPVTVDGAVEYSYTVSTTGGGITTVSTVRSSASTSVKIADYRTVTYSYVWDSTPDHVSPGSSAVFPAVPTDMERYYYGRSYTINVDTTVPTNYPIVQDEANKGHWEFDGWYRNNTGETVEKVGLSATDDDGLHFIGRWHFVLDYMPLTITKNVTGNMGDKTKEFPFTVTVTEPGKEGQTYTFSLKDAEHHTLESLPIGSTITIQEGQNEGYTVGVTYNGNPATDNKDRTWSFTLEEGKDKVIVTNFKHASPATNVPVDSTPYILILLLMAGIVLVWFRSSGTGPITFS